MPPTTASQSVIPPTSWASTAAAAVPAAVQIFLAPVMGRLAVELREQERIGHSILVGDHRALSLHAVGTQLIAVPVKLHHGLVDLVRTMLQVEIEYVASIVTVHPVDPQLQQDVGLLGAEMVLQELGRAPAVEDVTVQEAVTSGLKPLLLRRRGARDRQDDRQYDESRVAYREIGPRPQGPNLPYGEHEARGVTASSRR